MGSHLFCVCREREEEERGERENRKMMEKKREREATIYICDPAVIYKDCLLRMRRDKEELI